MKTESEEGVESSHAVESSTFLSTPVMVGLAAACGGIFGVGFRYGVHGAKKVDPDPAVKCGSGAAAASRSVASGAQRAAAAAPTAPATLAVRALGIATVISTSAFALGCIGVSKYLEVSSLQEFSDKMREIVPGFGNRVRKAVRIDEVKEGLDATFGSEAVKSKLAIPKPDDAQEKESEVEILVRALGGDATDNKNNKKE